MSKYRIRKGVRYQCRATIVNMPDYRIKKAVLDRGSSPIVDMRGGIPKSATRLVWYVERLHRCDCSYCGRDWEIFSGYFETESECVEWSKSLGEDIPIVSTFTSYRG